MQILGFFSITVKTSIGILIKIAYKIKSINDFG